MESKVRVFGHPLHQMLIVFPLGLLATSVVFDLIHLIGVSPSAATVAYALIAAGLVGGLIAAPWGTIDWLAVVVLLLFAASWWLRGGQDAQPPTLAWVLSFAGAGLALVTAWLGGELVDRLGVGVSPHAHLNARSSLDGPAEPVREAAGPVRGR
jgi:uncharacterized membrane protein